MNPLIPQDFAEAGFAANRRAPTPLARYQVLGERSSGTNFVSRLLGRNSSMRPATDLGWKHGFPREAPVPADLGVICMTRRADDWALSMHRKPWHAPPELQALEFGDFIRAPWETVVDRPRYFTAAMRAGPLGGPLLLDRDPETGAAFADLFALRTAKMRAMLGYMSRDCTCVLLSVETAQAEPEATLDALLYVMGHPPRSTPYRRVVKRLGSRFKPAIPERPKTPARMGKAGRRFMRARLDPELERQLGYSYDSPAD